jgi:hypothetical protein
MSYLRKVEMSHPLPKIRAWGQTLGWVTMSKRDLQRIEVLMEVLAVSRTAASAAAVLAVSVRQTQRLLNRDRDGGGGALTSLRRSGQPVHGVDDQLIALPDLVKGSPAIVAAWCPSRCPSP